MLTSEELNAINRNLESHLGLFSDAEMDRDQKTYCTFRPSELLNTKEAVDELLALRSLRDRGDEGINGRAGDIKKWTDLLLEKYVWQHLDIEGQVLVMDVATFAKEIADFAIARCKQLREAREEIERLDQVVQKLKDNFGEMEVGP